MNRLNSFLRSFAPALPPPAYARLRLLWWHVLAGADVHTAWKRRIGFVLSCPDTQVIPRVERAGQVAHGHQLMHNGLWVLAGGYYGYPIRDMLKQSRGVHEPQEERVFGEVLPYIQAGSTMLELGAYWSFYSMWFAKAIQDAHCITVEPDEASARVGQYNFKYNALKRIDIRAFIGATEDRRVDGVPLQNVDGILERHGVDRLAILHSDIQGAELQMLEGANHLLRGGRVDWVFISTHSNDLHKACEDHLKSAGLSIVSSIDLDDTFSEDGLIVAKRPGIPGPDRIELSRRMGREPADF